MKTSKKVKNAIKEQKKIYISILVIMTLGILLGIFFAIFLSKSDQNMVKDSITSFFQAIEKNDIHYKDALINSLIGNLSLALFLFLLGISIIGIPFIYLSVWAKSFVLGFSIASIFKVYGIKGIFKAFFYTMPHEAIFFFLLVFLSCSSIYFSKKLFSYLFLKQEINLRRSMKRYLQVFTISFFGSIVVSLLEVFLSPSLLRLF